MPYKPMSPSVYRKYINKAGWKVTIQVPPPFTAMSSKIPSH